MSRFVEFDHVYRCLQSLFMDSGREWLYVVEANQDTDIKKLILGDPQVAKDSLLGREGECGLRSSEINRGYELVHARI